MPRSRRSPNRITEGRLIDDAGNEWQPVSRELSRDEIARLLADPNVRVGVHAQRSLVRWVPESERQRVWTDVIEPNFHDREPQQNPRDSDPPPPFHGTSWRRRNKYVLLFDDFD